MPSRASSPSLPVVRRASHARIPRHLEKLIGLLGLTALLSTVATGNALAATTYRARNINGDQAPPPYGLRLDGFYDDQATTEVTFNFSDVYFDRYDDGTALLRGEIGVAEFNHTDAPAWQNLGPGTHANERYLLNVHFVQITDPAKLALIEHYRSDWTYYDIDTTGLEMQRVGMPSDSTHFWMYPANGMMPFQVGNGANEKNSNFGAAGWLSFFHYKSGQVYGDGPGTYINASDFLMDLEPTESLPCDTVRTVDNFTLRFLGVQYNFTAGTSRWDYELTWDGSPPELSQFTFELCKEICQDNVIAVTPSNGQVGKDGSTGLYGIKWDPPPHMPPGTPVKFSFTLNRLLDVDNAGFFPKAAVNCNYALICGPALDCRELSAPCTVNQPPYVQAPPVPDPIVCVPEDGKVCIPGWTFGDPDGNALTFGTMNSGTFDPATGTFCKTVGAPGQYTMMLGVSDSCGATATTSLTFEVVGNQPPEVSIASDTVLLCEADSICLDVHVEDENPEQLTYHTNFGCVEAGRFCFVADTSGDYTVIVSVTDGCGQTVADTAVVSVIINQPPTVALVGSGQRAQAAVGTPLTMFATRTGETISICEGDASVCLQSRLFVADPDPGDEVHVTLPDGVDWNSSTGVLCLSNPQPGERTLVFLAADTCGATAAETLCVVVQAGTPPSLEFSSPDTTLFVCDPDTFLCFTVTAHGSEPLTIEEVLNPGTFNGATGEFCFNPDSICFDHPATVDTTICIVFRATNDCGSTTDSLCIHVVTQPPPQVALPADTAISLCALGEVCLGPVVIANPSGSPLTISGFGALYREGQLCFTPSEPGGYYVGVEVTDTCGHTVRDSMHVDVRLNTLPVIAGPTADTAGICGSSQVCVGPYQFTDADGDNVSVTVSGGAAFDIEGQDVCFTAAETGDYEFVITASDLCGSVNKTVLVHVQANAPPVWTHVPDTLVTGCTPGDSICFSFAASDPDGDPITYGVNVLPDSLPEHLELIYAPAGTHCFLPSGSGTYRFLVAASDGCHENVLDTVVVRVNFNTPPRLIFSLPDTALTVCAADTFICFNVSAQDADGDAVVIREILNPGSFDQETGRVCFNPDSVCFNSPMTMDTTICLIFGVSDPCGPEVVDSLCITIMINGPPMVHLPMPQVVNLCAPGQVCVPGAMVTDPDGDPLNIEASGGATYQSGSLCFAASGPGQYQIGLCATDPCGHTTCDTTVIEVRMNSAPTVQFGSDQFVSLCTPGQVCVELPQINDPDGEIPTLQFEGATQQGNQLCYMATGAGSHSIVVRAIDSCGAMGADTLRVTVAMNTAPRVLIRNAPPLTLCDIDTTLCYPVMISDIDGSPLADVKLIKTDLHFWSWTGQYLCLDASVAMSGRTQGTFQAIIEATDACGAKARDTLLVSLKANQAPFAQLPADTSVVLCEAGELCLGPVTYGDPDNSHLDVSVQGGVLSGDQICLTLTRDTTLEVVLTVQDSCGATAADTMHVTAHLNRPPIVVVPDFNTLSLCALDTFCVEGIEGHDPELGRLPAALRSGPGQFDPATGRLCFVPDHDGQYTFTFEVNDGCAVVAADWIVQVTANRPPAFQASPSITDFECHPGDTACLNFLATDPEGDPLVYSLQSGPGQIDQATGRVCFAPTESGNYTFVVSARDSCGVAVLDTGHASIQINRPPSLQFSGGDTSLFVCDPDTLLCFTVTATDPDGGTPVISEVRNPGDFNPLTGVFCFNPSLCFGDPHTHDTTICVVFAATDSCGATSVDSLCVQVTRNRAPLVNLGPDHPVLLCSAGPLCVDLSGVATDPDGDPLTLSTDAPASITEGSVCMNVTTAGIKRFVVCATDPCGLSTCDTLYLNVSLNVAPVVTLPPDTSVVTCVTGQVCVGPVSISDGNPQDQPEVTITGGAQLIGNELCFEPPGDGLYTFVVTASDLCGASDVDTVAVRVERNDPPSLAFSSADTSITLCHSDTNLCFQVTATDPDGEPLEIHEVLVPGSFDPATGEFCFNPDSVCFHSPLMMDTTICCIFSVTDRCGVTTTDSLCVEVRVNRAPELHFSVPDTTLYICRIDTLLCFGVTATDPEGEPVVIREILNPGDYYPELGLFCFQPVNVCFPNLPCSAPPTCLVFEAEDACGNVTRDTLCLEIFANLKPVVVAPDSVQSILCQPGDQVCIDSVYANDVEDGSLLVTAPGAIYDPRLRTLCFTADTTGVYQFAATASDACGAQDTALITVRVDANLTPVVLVPADTSILLCGPDTVCFPVTVPHPDNAWTVSQVMGPAHYDPTTSLLCVAVLSDATPILAGVTVTDECGATTSAQFTIDATFNHAPQVTLPADFAVKVCQPGPYCFGPVAISDPDFNLAGAPVVTGGTYDAGSGQLCIDATAGGHHQVVVSVTDSCGAQATDTVSVDVTLNRAPLTHFSSPDTSLFLCTPDTVLCFTFSAVDPDGGLVLLNEILNPGVFDPLTGEFCFNPAEVCFDNHDSYDTTLCLIFSATDTCGLEVWDTLCIEVTANEAPLVLAPADTSITACQGDSICLNPFVVTDPNGPKDVLTVTSSGPAHAFDPSTGKLCFVAGPGTYRFGVTATDRCGASAHDSVSVTVSANQAPVVTLPADFTSTSCIDSDLCIPVLANDPDFGDELLITAVSPFARYDEASASLCFTPDTSGVYLVIAQVVDLCGLSDRDTVRVTVTLNRAPFWVSVPQIDSFFCAPPGPICFSVRAQDPDGQPLIYIKREGPGTIDSATGLICFNPGTTPGRYNFVVTACDPCGAVVNDTASVMVRFNQPPVFPPVHDTLVAQCQPTQVCFSGLSATDPDGGVLTYALLAGTGTLSGGTYCFTPDTSGLYRISIKATDACQKADTLLFFASVRMNVPPVLHLPAASTEFLCSIRELCVGGISATDQDGGPVTITKTAGPGTFNPSTGQVCFTPTGPGTVNFDFRAVDTCGSFATGRVTVTVQLNRAPTLDVPNQVSVCRDSLVCLSVGALDPDISNRLVVTQLSGPAGTFSPSPLSGPAPLSGQWCWRAPTAGSYLVVFQVSDSCGSVAVDTTRIDVSEFCDTLCFAATIPNLCPDAQHPDNWLFQGRAHVFPVMVTPSRDVGAFDFLIGYDASALTVQGVAKGTDISAWEFFTYRILDPNTDCSGLCPSGLLHIVGIADMNNGVPIHDPSQTQPSTQPREYARITFQVSNDRTLAGQFVPVTFWWNDCGDNTFSSPQGDLLVSNTINPDTCVGAGAKELIEACATFQGGGGCIPTISDIDDRGDLNLNGIAYEIADAVLYSNYFIFGPSVFDPNPIRNASQVAASDVNADGSTLTVADLVFLIRIILGLEEPKDPGVGRVSPAGVASVHWLYEGDEAALVLENSTSTGALALEARVAGSPRDVLLSDEALAKGLELKWHVEGDRLKILVYSMTAGSLEPGVRTILRVHGGFQPESVRAEASDERGSVVTMTLKSAATLPQAFDLDPNFPNPFNPETEIRFTLYRDAMVSLTVFNVLGQPVSRLVEGRTLAAGPYQFRWLARDERGTMLPSGVYMYRLTADSYSETRKMLLLR